MTIQQRIPVGDIAVQWSRSAGAQNCILVDDSIGYPDDDATYIYTGTGFNKDYFGFDVFAIPTGSTIASITVKGRCKLVLAGGAPNIRALLKVNGVSYAGSGIQVYYGSYTNWQQTWTVNPNTGQAWTVDDVNGVGSNPVETFGLEYISVQDVRCTQIYIEVDFTGPVAERLLMRTVSPGAGILMRDVASGKLMRAVEGYMCPCALNSREAKFIVEISGCSNSEFSEGDVNGIHRLDYWQMDFNWDMCTWRRKTSLERILVNVGVNAYIEADVWGVPGGEGDPDWIQVYVHDTGESCETMTAGTDLAPDGGTGLATFYEE